MKFMPMSLLGLAIALGAILGSQLFEGTGLGGIVQPTAFLIVFGGTLGAVVSQSSAKEFMLSMQITRWLFNSPVTERDDYIKEIVGWSKLAHRNGTLRLDALTDTIEDSLLKSGVEMIVDRYNPEDIRDTLLLEVRIRDARLKNAAKLWESAGGYAPTVGILGSVLGLLHIMNGLDDPSKLGAGIAVAFVATIYGLGLANLVFLPIAAKLRSVIFELTLRDELRIEGLTMIAKGKVPQLVERTLVSVSAEASNPVSLKSSAA